jgi:hypothetical protein
MTPFGWCTRGIIDSPGFPDEKRGKIQLEYPKDQDSNRISLEYVKEEMLLGVIFVQHEKPRYLCGYSEYVVYCITGKSVFDFRQSQNIISSANLLVRLWGPLSPYPMCNRDNFSGDIKTGA